MADKAEATSATSCTLKLSSGVELPAVGLGLWKSKSGEVAAAIRTALECGVRLLDGAAAYDNEAEVGDALKQAIADSVVKRSEVFLVSKIFNSMHVWGDDRARVQEAMAKTLSDLQTDYVDLYLMHWPFAIEQKDYKAHGPMRGKDGTPNPKLTVQEEFLNTYEEMLKLKAEGKARAVGVCNFKQQQLEALLKAFPNDPPSVNQCEIHPYLSQPELKSFCDSHGIAMMAYSPLGSGDSYSGTTFPLKGTGVFQNPDAGTSLLQNNVIGEIAKKNGKSPAQVLIHWSVRKGFCCIPKSVRAERIRENSDVFDWALDGEDLARIDGLNCGFRYGIGWAPGHYDCPNAPWYKDSAAA